MNKYLTHREEIKSGDVIIFRSKKWLGRIIQWIDNSYYNHAGIAFWSNDILFIVDSNENGVRPEFMSIRMSKYVDFCALRPRKFNNKRIKKAINKSLRRGNSIIKYDFFLALKILFIKKLNINFKGFYSPNRDICSEFVRYYLDNFSDCYSSLTMPTPQDLIRYANKDKIEILFNK